MLSKRIQVRYGDIDAQGHVNNLAHLQFVEAARSALFDQAGLPWNPGQVIRRQDIDYLAPIPPGQGEVVAELRCAAIGRTSYTLAFRLVDDTGAVFSHGTTVMVSIDRNGRPEPIATSLQVILASCMGADSIV